MKLSKEEFTGKLKAHIGEDALEWKEMTTAMLDEFYKLYVDSEFDTFEEWAEDIETDPNIVENSRE